VNSELDRMLMERAIEVGRSARFWSAPNPAVGCVLSKGDTVIGTGFTQPAGRQHAEIMALAEASDPRGATAYVTLEPCSHVGKTGPCVDALIQAGVSRVVTSLEDPNQAVSGRGIAALRAAGIAVDVGLLADTVENDLAGFLQRMRRGWGRITLKVAVSLDGRTAMASGESQWITGEAARRDVQVLRAEADLIVTGVGTVLADDCRLTLRSDELPLNDEEKARALAHPPARMVLDSGGRTPERAALLSEPAATIVVTPTAKQANSWLATVVDADDEGRVCLQAWVKLLGERQHNEVLVEAGPKLAGALIAGGWVDRLVVYQAPKLLGQNAAPMAAFDIDVLSDAPGFQIREVTRIGEDLRMIAMRVPPADLQ